MKIRSIIPTVSMLAFFVGSSSAFWGKLKLGSVCQNEGCFLSLNLVDYHTGSTYECGDVPYSVGLGPYPTTCYETSSGGYNFPITFWTTKDGCNNINFEGAFGGAGHGYCCAKTCNIGA